jgi:hypothetical protein
MRSGTVIVSNAGDVVASDPSLASVNYNPAAPKTGTALLLRFRFEFMREAWRRRGLIGPAKRPTVSWHLSTAPF